MTKEELVEFLRENIRVELATKWNTGRDTYRQALVVRIHLSGELIASDHLDLRDLVEQL